MRRERVEQRARILPEITIRLSVLTAHVARDRTSETHLFAIQVGLRVVAVLIECPDSAHGRVVVCARVRVVGLNGRG